MAYFNIFLSRLYIPILGKQICYQWPFHRSVVQSGRYYHIRHFICQLKGSHSLNLIITMNRFHVAQCDWLVSKQQGKLDLKVNPRFKTIAPSLELLCWHISFLLDHFPAKVMFKLVWMMNE